MEWIDFKEVKGLATMSGLLQHYQVRLRGSSFQLRGNCPLPSHTAKDGNSFNVNLDRNIWSCKSASCIANRNGKEGGNVLDFVVQMEGCDLKTAAGKIVEWFGVKQKPPLPESRSGEVSNSNPTAPASEHNLVDWLTGPTQEKTPPNTQAGVGVENSSPLDPTSNPSNGKGYMKDVDVWFDSLVSDQPDWKIIKNAVKGRLIESYKAGKAARM